ncbi:MAG: hypothetical protein AABX10_01925 [Nanoarchaeota archaeon]
MRKKDISSKIKVILINTAIILLIPLFGNKFIDGWNWGFGEFIFAAVFFIGTGLIYSFGVSRVRNKKGRLALGIFIALALAFIWVVLATG